MGMEKETKRIGGKLFSRSEREESRPGQTGGTQSPLLLPPPVGKQSRSKVPLTLGPIARRVGRPQPRGERANAPPGLGLPLLPAPQLHSA